MLIQAETNELDLDPTETMQTDKGLYCQQLLAVEFSDDVRVNSSLSHTSWKFDPPCASVFYKVAPVKRHDSSWLWSSFTILS